MTDSNANAAKSPIKQSAAAINDALADVWPQVVIMAADGKEIDKKSSKRAVLGALSLYMRSVGAMQRPGRKAGAAATAKVVDHSNLHNATYMAFATNAKGTTPTLSLPALLNATAVIMSVPFEDFDKAKRDVRKALDTHPLLAIKQGARKFDGTTVVLRGEAVNPVPFRKWGEPAPAQAGAPVFPMAAPAAAPSDANGKIKRRPKAGEPATA